MRTPRIKITARSIKGSPLAAWLKKHHQRLVRGSIVTAPILRPVPTPKPPPPPPPPPKPVPPPPLPITKTVREKALDHLRLKLGTKESPANSNICWATKWYGMNGQPWCAMAASWAYAMAGSKRFKAGTHYHYVPSIVNDARNRLNGLRLVDVPIPGDLVCYDWPGESKGLADHVGIFEKWVIHGDTFVAIEGNTSLTNQSNGGEVMRRTRTKSLVQAFVRVNEPA